MSSCWVRWSAALLAVPIAAGACGRVGFDLIPSGSGGASAAGAASGAGGGGLATGGAGGYGPDAGTGGAPGLDAAADPDAAPRTGWEYRKAVVIDPSFVEADMSNFPLLVRTASDTELASGVALAGGADIRFVAGDGIQLDHEIERFDATTGELVAWVRVPLVSASAATRLYLEYGNPQAAPQENAAAVWSSGYVSVWHLAEDPGSGGEGAIIDSTGKSPGTAHETMTAEDLVPGQIGGAIDFDGVDDEITFENTFTGSGPHTISAWVNQRATMDTDAIIAFGTDNLNEARWFYGSFGAGRNLSVGLYTNDFTSNVDIRGNGFIHVVWTYDGSESRLYVDGKLADSAPHSGADTTGTTGWIGNVFIPGPKGFGPDQHMDGQLDEIRVYAGVLDADRIAAEYANQAAPMSFASLGSAERTEK